MAHQQYPPLAAAGQLMRRRLTAGEKSAAALLFGSSLDTDAVWIYCGLPFWPWHRTAVSPNGHIYFPRRAFRDDFTQEPHALKWLVHELVHVWQWQNGFHTLLGGLLLACRGGYFRGRAYRCPPPEQIDCLSQLNMEQQAEILADYFMRRYTAANSVQAIPPYLDGFCRNPADRSLMPRYRAKMTK
ncbi:type IV secretion protein Rhs [Neisseria leonii]|uniref:Type IV secretion protein Rhs n=1 Tax=Neisseria leonii TaxID=2995413 RepID=A0A9X4E7E9_9NEIS|nr:type IV secretion protein Rhs [Neisseria sp. 51.81]MDD9326903.1 type IV secretion protein Rhs [Neisseria sp. 51.81]